MREPYSDVEFEIGATFDGNTWVGEFRIWKKIPDGTSVDNPTYRQAPGEFQSEGAARDAAREHAKQFIDRGLTD